MLVSRSDNGQGTDCIDLTVEQLLMQGQAVLLLSLAQRRELCGEEKAQFHVFLLSTMKAWLEWTLLGMHPHHSALELKDFSYQKRNEATKSGHSHRKRNWPRAGERQFLIHISPCSSHTSCPSYPRSGVFSSLYSSSISVWMSVPAKLFLLQ